MLQQIFYGNQYHHPHPDNIKLHVLTATPYILLRIMDQPGVKIRTHQRVVGIQYTYPHQDNTKRRVLMVEPSILLQIMVHLGVKIQVLQQM